MQVFNSPYHYQTKLIDFLFKIKSRFTAQVHLKTKPKQKGIINQSATRISAHIIYT